MDGLTVIYDGARRAGNGYVAHFEVSGALQSPPGELFFLPSGPSVALEQSGSVVVSEAFTIRGDADPSTLFAWRIGSETVVWELGAIEAN